MSELLEAIAEIKSRPGWRVEASGRGWDAYALYNWRGGDAPAAQVLFRTCEVRMILDTGTDTAPFDAAQYRAGKSFPPRYDFTPLLREIEERIAEAKAEASRFFRTDPERGENIAVVATGALFDGFPYKTAPIEPHELCEDKTFVRAPYVAHVRAIINPSAVMRERVDELGF